MSTRIWVAIGELVCERTGLLQRCDAATESGVYARF
jgi:hypothetical protein